MKKISIECAGSGKTYGIAQKIKEHISTCSNDKYIYAITFTNNAVKKISEEIIKQIGYIPNNVILQTIHTFMLERIIYPFSKFILDKNITLCSIDELPDNPKYKNYYKSQMLNEQILHSEFAMNYAKRILCPNSTDKKNIRTRKKIVLNHFIGNIDCLYIDEVQDMDKDFFAILDFLSHTQLNLYIVGDFRQALKYPNTLLDFLKNKNTFEVSYVNTTRRVPEKHLFFANQLYESEYLNTNKDNFQGFITYSYEEEHNIVELITKYNLSFIDKSNDRFTTNSYDDNSIWFTKEEKDIICANFQGNKEAYVKSVICQLKADYKIIKNEKQVIKNFFKETINKKLYAKIIQIFTQSHNEKYMTNSIEKIKGLEGDKCLFFVSHNMLDILMGNNKKNKQTNTLYVALTRSKNILHLVLLKECTNKIEKQKIDEFMIKNNVIHYNNEVFSE